MLGEFGVQMAIRAALLVFICAWTVAPTRVLSQATPLSAAAKKVDGRVFLTLDGIVGLRRLPDWVSPYLVAGIGGSRYSAGFFRPELALSGPVATIGYVFDKAHMPAWLGANTQVSLAGAGWWAQWTQSAFITRTNFTLPSEAPLPRFFHRLHIDHREGELVLRFATDWPVDPGLTLSPILAAFGGASRTRYQYNAHLFDTQGRPTHPYWLYELLRGYSVGGFAGMRLRWRASRWLSVTTETHVGGYYAWLSRRARDCFLNATAPFCQGAGAVTNTLNATDATVGIRTGVTTVFTIRLRRSSIDVGGFAMFQSASPTVRNQKRGVLPLAGVPAVAGFTPAWTAGGFIRWRIPFTIR